MVWESDANSGETRSDESWDSWCCRRDDRERSRPEGVGEKCDARIFKRGGGEDEREIGAVSNVHDERIKGGPPLRFEDARDGDWIKRIGAEPVDRLGGEGDKATST